MLPALKVFRDLQVLKERKALKAPKAIKVRAAYRGFKVLLDLRVLKV